ncbi:carbohydrate ABC transporter ATP-binding protein, CUT1 family (TC 3.A.1.1.-) [Roseibium hamelinense]|uniref:Carbohydrate ABC transporter ATP-binding protein, CUT1 family (TC 3.A.1.1.-) n=1 Tax=Roseibium hamelinense TaxID=150831 RepID=A0A562SXA0_9HYPH|nr:ABC transporter ATP-binding protein [Roseibium hamelinense]MTI44889.1 ABC transporter ATP-binding protein [Roseibium hamelinense]TWI85917.1 carbohydrate ABC transporter ATP-binding protein, CUT1 family (TC 3.A.1.1.-) [Roseibium hamelinense]
MSLELINVSKRVGVEQHIYPTDLKLEPGGLNILLGTTLSGKTTLMQMMAGLDKLTTGELRFNGRDVTKTPVQKRNVSMVYQQFINYPNFSVFENIASPLRVAGVAEGEIKRRVGEMSELMKLSGMLDRRPSELSGGQQQRTAMARALVKDADLVLLDEPLANLDFKLREELRDELPRLFADRNCVVVYATTEPVEALLFGGNTATLHEGRVTQFGPTSEIYRNPKDLISAEVFSEPPINHGDVVKSGSTITLSGGGSWPATGAAASLADGKYTLGLRPHHVTPQDDGGQSIEVSGEVLVTEISGSESVIHFTIGGRTWVSQSHGVHPVEVGEVEQLFADVSQAFYFDASGALVAG